MEKRKYQIYPFYFHGLCHEYKIEPVVLLWEIKGPPNTEIAWLSCYAVGRTIAIVQTYKGGNGWNVLTPLASQSIADSMADLIERAK